MPGAHHLLTCRRHTSTDLLKQNGSTFSSKLYIPVTLIGLKPAQILKRSAKLHLVRSLHLGRRNHPRKRLEIVTMNIDLEQVCSELAARKLRTKSSIELTRLLIDQSFLRFKVSHRSLYAAQQSQERLDRVLKAIESGTVRSEMSANSVRAKRRLDRLDSGRSAKNVLCGHCEGILFNKKTFRVWTQEDGVILLDMVVCYACKLEAQRLGLNTERVKASATRRHKDRFFVP